MYKRRIKQRMFKTLCGVFAAITASLLVIIIGFIFYTGSSALSLDFILTSELDAEGMNNGVANAIAGTLLLTFFCIVIAAPLAIAMAIYMAEYAAENRFTKTLRFLIELMSGMPSIVLGLLGLIILAFHLKYFTAGLSLLSASIALAILVVPTVERAAEEAIKTVPNGLKEASFALGSTKWQCIQKVVIPNSLSGIVTGIVLGLGRAAEESAVVVLTAGYAMYMPEFGLQPSSKVFMGTKVLPLHDSVASLPIAVYHAFQLPHMIPPANAFATATVLIVLVMLINLTAKAIAWKYMAYEAK